MQWLGDLLQGQRSSSLPGHLLKALQMGKREEAGGLINNNSKLSQWKSEELNILKKLLLVL